MVSWFFSSVNESSRTEQNNDLDLVILNVNPLFISSDDWCWSFVSFKPWKTVWQVDLSHSLAVSCRTETLSSWSVDSWVIEWPVSYIILNVSDELITPHLIKQNTSEKQAYQCNIFYIFCFEKLPYDTYSASFNLNTIHIKQWEFDNCSIIY